MWSEPCAVARSICSPIRDTDQTDQESRPKVPYRLSPSCAVTAESFQALDPNTCNRRAPQVAQLFGERRTCFTRGSEDKCLTAAITHDDLTAIGSDFAQAGEVADEFAGSCRSGHVTHPCLTSLACQYDKTLRGPQTASLKDTRLPVTRRQTVYYRHSAYACRPHLPRRPRARIEADEGRQAPATCRVGNLLSPPTPLPGVAPRQCFLQVWNGEFNVGREGLDALMSQGFLHVPEVRSVADQFRGKGPPESMSRYMHRQPGLLGHGQCRAEVVSRAEVVRLPISP